jgi:hypothetical protein
MFFNQASTIKKIKSRTIDVPTRLVRPHSHPISKEGAMHRNGHSHSEESVQTKHDNLFTPTFNRIYLFKIGFKDINGSINEEKEWFHEHVRHR